MSEMYTRVRFLTLVKISKIMKNKKMISRMFQCYIISFVTTLIQHFL